MNESSKNFKKLNSKNFPTLEIVSDKEIALDFANKVYKKFNTMIKSIVLFGSTTKQTKTSGSDIDLIIIVDDASVQFDTELIGWYREELGRILVANPYKKELHVNTIKLTTWWIDLLRGDPIVINIIRYGEEIIDFGGFFRPLRILLQEGKIKPTAEAIYTSLERAPMHLANSKRAEMSSIEGVYWAMVESAHALLIAGKITPASPEQIPELLRQNFVNRKLLSDKYVVWYSDVFKLYKDIAHGNIMDVKGQSIDDMQAKAEEFIRVIAETIRRVL